VVFGNSAFAANQYLGNAGNANLALNAVDWLAKQEQALGIAPRSPEQVQLFLSAGQMQRVLLISLIGLRRAQLPSASPCGGAAGARRCACESAD